MHFMHLLSVLHHQIVCIHYFTLFAQCTVTFAKIQTKVSWFLGPRHHMHFCIMKSAWKMHNGKTYQQSRLPANYIYRSADL